MGLLDFLGFGKREKPNLMPEFRELPQANHAPLFGDLETFARNRISGKTAGYGDDFVSKTANPVIAQREARHREQTMPQINSELSKRGIARSAGPGLATDIIGRAENQKQRDIDEIMSNFYQLNEAQKKRDTSEGVQVGDQLNTQWLNQANAATGAFNQMQENVTDRGVAQANIKNAERQQNQNRTLGAMGLLVGGPATASIFSGSPTSQASQATTSKPISGTSATTAKVLHSSSNSLGGFSLEDLLEALKGF